MGEYPELVAAGVLLGVGFAIVFAVVALSVRSANRRRRRLAAISKALGEYAADPTNVEAWHEALALARELSGGSIELSRFLAENARSWLRSAQRPGDVLLLLANHCRPLPEPYLLQELMLALADFLALNAAQDFLVQDVLNALSWMGISNNQSYWFYAFSLRQLEDPAANAATKRLVLHVGRWHFGRIRPGGVPTVYDEQAIQNDILVRTK